MLVYYMFVFGRLHFARTAQVPNVDDTLQEKKIAWNKILKRLRSVQPPAYAAGGHK